MKNCKKKFNKNGRKLKEKVEVKVIVILVMMTVIV